MESQCGGQTRGDELRFHKMVTKPFDDGVFKLYEILFAGTLVVLDEQFFLSKNSLRVLRVLSKNSD